MTVKNGLSDGEILTVRQTRIYDKGERNVFIKIFGDWNGLSVQHAHTGSGLPAHFKAVRKKAEKPAHGSASVIPLRAGRHLFRDRPSGYPLLQL